jgi:hypothetical protein
MVKYPVRESTMVSSDVDEASRSTANTYRAGLGDLQAVCKSLAADYGGDLMHKLLGVSRVCGL